MPLNIRIFSSLFQQIITFELLPHEVLSKAIFSFKNFATAPKYSYAGYGTSNFLINAGSSFYVFLIWLLATLVYFILKRRPQRFKKVKAWLKRYLFFAVLIRIILELYLDFVISALINFTQFDWTYSGEAMGILLSWIALFILVPLPILVFMFLKRYQMRFLKPKF